MDGHIQKYIFTKGYNLIMLSAKKKIERTLSNLSKWNLNFRTGPFYQLKFVNIFTQETNISYIPN